MNKIFIYIYILIIVLILILINMNQSDTEGFEIPWYARDYFVIPLLMTLFILAPLIYLIYSVLLRRANEALSSLNTV